MPIPIIFFGTHNFAATILEGLINSPFIEVELIISQPDKPVGRKQELQETPVKQIAKKYKIKIDQPETFKNYNLKIKNSTLGIVAQYGKIIPKDILDMPKHGMVNVHTSLLPKYRGASPIQCALINGEKETGITLIKMDEGMDTGPIIAQKSLKIDENDTYPNLDEKLANLGLELLLNSIPDYEAGKITPKKQDESRASTCKLLKKEDGQIDWQKTSEEIYNLYRGLTPWPGVWTNWDNKKLKLLKIKPANKNLAPGEVKIEDKKIFIGTIDKSIEVLELQLEGKRKMTANEFTNGYATINGSSLN